MPPAQPQTLRLPRPGGRDGDETVRRQTRDAHPVPVPARDVQAQRGRRPGHHGGCHGRGQGADPHGWQRRGGEANRRRRQGVLHVPGVSRPRHRPGTVRGVRELRLLRRSGFRRGYEPSHAQVRVDQVRPRRSDDGGGRFTRVGVAGGSMARRAGKDP